MNIVVFSLVLGVVYGTSPETQDNYNSRIIGGSSIEITQVPYQIIIGNATAIWCGGTIISEKYIITAAHCFDDHDLMSEGFLVSAGITNLNELNNQIAHGVYAVHLHPGYIRDRYYKDLAIIELKGGLEFNDKIQKVDLPLFKEEVPIGAFGYISGWGRREESGPTSMELQGAGVQFLSDRDCYRYGQFDRTYMICAGSLDGIVDACQGDSGDPLVYNRILYGVISYGRGCGNPGFPAVYTDVANLRDFINKITGL